MDLTYDSLTWQRLAIRLLNQGHPAIARRIQRHLQCGAYHIWFPSADAFTILALAGVGPPPTTPTADAADRWLRAGATPAP